MYKEIITALTAFIITVILGFFVIPILTELKFGQTVRSDGPKRHLKKTGTPTMGGVLFIPAIVIAALINSHRSLNLIIAILSMICFGLIGFFDDYIKIVKKRALGLRATYKLLFQFLFSLGLTYYAYKIFPRGTVVLLPFIKEGIELGTFFIPFTIFVTIGTVNSVNLTDGLDGLVSGIMIIISIFYMLISITLGLSDFGIFSAAIAGGCLGFLVFNKFPAKVFMGDTGSLGLGGALAALAVMTGTQFYLVFFGMIFIIETLSVVLQVISFRLTGKRLFKMSPIHHHFELMGWSEKKVVIMFWLFTLLSCFLGYFIFVKTFV